MLVAVSALDVAFVSAIAAVVASVVSPFTSAVIARSNRSHERLLTREERGFEARRAAYEAVLTGIASDMYQARDWLARIEKGEARIEAPEGTMDPALVESWSEEAGRLATVASEEIMAAWETLANATVVFWRRVVEATQRGTLGDTVDPFVADELRPLLEAVQEQRKLFEQLIRADLRGA